MPHVFDMLPLEQRPLLVAIAGPNGAGKTTFYRAHLADLGLRYINADDIARTLDLPVYEAATAAAYARERALTAGESFVFETVFSDPEGEKLSFLQRAAAEGYSVILFFIGVASADVSEVRVLQRVASGGHDVPPDKVHSRFPRALANLQRATRALPHVVVYDNSNPGAPFQLVALFTDGQLVTSHPPIPGWARALLKPHSS